MNDNQGLCKYKNLFGEPGTGLHSIRIFNIAIVDVILTIILALIIHQLLLEKWLNIHYIPLWWVIVGSFILGIVSHRLFCVRTTIDKLIFD